MGVTKRVYEEHGGTKDMKDLTVEDVAPIYKKGYWDKMKGDDLPGGLDLCVFDFGVNAGPGRAAKYPQSMIGTTTTVVLVPMTLAALQKYVDENGLVESIEEYPKRRQEYYEKLSTFATFGRGWTRRVNETTELAPNTNLMFKSFKIAILLSIMAGAGGGFLCQKNPKADLAVSKPNNAQTRTKY